MIGILNILVSVGLDLKAMDVRVVIRKRSVKSFRIKDCVMPMLCVHRAVRVNIAETHLVRILRRRNTSASARRT